MVRRANIKLKHLEINVVYHHIFIKEKTVEFCQQSDNIHNICGYFI